MSRKALSFEQALAALGAAKRPSAAALRALSNLTSEQMPAFITLFRELSDDRRALIIESLDKLATDDIELNCSAIFHSALADDDLRVRTLSIKGLWEDVSPSRITTLISLMRDDPAEVVRAAAAAGLGPFMKVGEFEQLTRSQRDRVYSALMAVILTNSSESPVYQQALQSVAYASNEEVVRLIREAYASQDESLRISALIAMGHSGDETFSPLLRKALNNVQPAIRLWAARACEELELEDAAADLGSLLDDPDREVVLAAIEALGATPGDDARQLLLRVRDSTDEDLSLLATEALFENEILSGDVPFDELFLSSFDVADDEEKTDKA